MSIDASRPSVGTSATKIAENTDATDVRSFVIKNKTGSASVFLDGDNTVVTGSNSFEWEVADGPFSIELKPTEEVWGIVASTSQTLHVLSGGT